MKVIALLALVLGAAPAWAGQSSITEGKLETREGAKVVAVPLEHTEVKVRIDGFIADVEVDQRFTNPYAKKIEAIYLFPLPAQSAVNGYEIETGGRTIKGEIKLREEATAIYKAARTKGHVAALLTQERPNLFTQSVANIEPGAAVHVRLRYVQALAYDAGSYELVFPMVAGPRHVPKTSKVDAAAVQPAVLPPGLRSGHHIGLSVVLDAGVPVRNVRSPSHAIEISTPTPREAKVKVGAHDAIPNKDFILRYDVAGDRPEFAIVPHRAGGTGSFFLMAQPPVSPDAAQVTPKEMVFVVDTSSSMQGPPLEKAKAAISRALKGMRPDDTFQIVRFDDTASGLGGKMLANKPKNLEHALAWLGQLEAGGGTDMTTGIRAALGFPHDPARLRIVVFLTDGFIGNEDEILALVQEQLGEARLFSFGVGSSVNRYLLEEMAAIGRGAVQVVRPDEDTAAAVEQMERRIASPLLTDIAIDWKGLAVEDTSPARIPDLFAGQPLVLAGRYAKPGAATVSIRGKLAGREVTFDVPVVLPEARERPAIEAIWARGKITELTRQQLRAEKPEIKQKIVELALASHLMSRYTAFVAVDTSRTTSGGAPERVSVPVEVPAGLHSTQGDYGGSGGGVIHGLEGGVANGYAEGVSMGVMAKVAKPVEVLERSSGLRVAGDSADLALPAPEPPTSPPPPPAPQQPPLAAPPPARYVSPKAPLPKDKAPPDPDTPVTVMRADVARCWAARGELRVSIEFDPDGSSRSVKVNGSPDAVVTECVRGASKRWRSRGGKNLVLSLTR